METSQRIYDAAKHAFLKFGYHGTTIDKIARYAGSGKAMVHYYYKSKDELFKLIFRDYIMLLSDALNKHKAEKSHPINQGIEYPELYEIAWFIASEFKYNHELAIKTIRENKELTAIFLKSYNNPGWLENFQNIITAQLQAIFIRNNFKIQN
ncbi:MULTISPECIES: TetR/AcrR family transcriptional regulator [Marinilabiliaceae]|uniref:TetR/AcrR family transcriptional regulator n=1 Tax=Plebeiibacterium sediminum TaxID=2992112 RepID=A0AAE3M8M0_9BACT|nr:TetR/AcrR family transcriptional regulator [Plebeiobacterium sediminum]MCU4165739.1 TetR/AcrR family transcriptional regulator [Marinilabiliaceae bacterium A049]MCW3788977.1 TetR/AcrR family transcriptional regulator [Plebeiobacterium sediminum]